MKPTVAERMNLLLRLENGKQHKAEQRRKETIWQRAGGRGQRVMRTGKGEVRKDGEFSGGAGPSPVLRLPYRKPLSLHHCHKGAPYLQHVSVDHRDTGDFTSLLFTAKLLASGGEDSSQEESGRREMRGADLDVPGEGHQGGMEGDREDEGTPTRRDEPLTRTDPQAEGSAGGGDDPPAVQVPGEGGDPNQRNNKAGTISSPSSSSAPSSSSSSSPSSPPPPPPSPSPPTSHTTGVQSRSPEPCWYCLRSLEPEHRPQDPPQQPYVVASQQDYHAGAAAPPGGQRVNYQTDPRPHFGVACSSRSTALPLWGSEGPSWVLRNPDLEDQTHTCPHCHIGLPPDTLRWHEAKCLLFEGFEI
ncbi:hypothetical protein N1851_015170 [Merluccius polli]|uniref:Uncharacterized protein n=1 Tax=Merluccius polli TaxID=89951 RepID=A0AA47MTM9_MERPO|nr:hypothetical protein N1851_015170 [Merluccius polli]